MKTSNHVFPNHQHAFLWILNHNKSLIWLIIEILDHARFLRWLGNTNIYIQGKEKWATHTSLLGCGPEKITWVGALRGETISAIVGRGEGLVGVESHANVMERPVQLQEQFQERQVVFLRVFVRGFFLYHSIYKCLVYYRLPF